MRSASTLSFSDALQAAAGAAMKKRAGKARRRGREEEEEDEALCCCEYVNSRGERSHVAACCCDCEDLDDAFDRSSEGVSAGGGSGAVVSEQRRHSGSPCVRPGL